MMEYQKEIKILSAEKDDSGRFRLKINNPFMLPVVLLIFSMVVSFIFLAAKQVTDRYFPYEGTVIGIEKKWYDSFLFETSDDEHLIIETSSGEEIDRYIDTFERINNRIAVGATVVKRKGFNEPVRAIGKKNTDELIEEIKEKLKE